MNSNEKNRSPNPPKLALAGPLGPCAIGVIQLAGNGSVELFSRFFSRPLPDLPGQITLGTFHDGHNRPIDQVLAVNLPGPIVEITCHGGVRIVQRIIDTLKHAGATLIDAETLIPESFGLEKLVESEAYRLLPNAKTTLAVKFLLAQAHGELDKLIKTGGTETSRQAALKYWPTIRFLLQGLKIVIAGPPNVGKSTLLNALAQSPQALVADLPGTTRDYVQIETEFSGLPATLIDTACLGKTNDPLAQEVRRRSLQQIAGADLVLIMLDAADPESNQHFLAELPQNISRAILLINKIDLTPSGEMQDSSTLSALSFPQSRESIFFNTWSEVKISALRQQNLDKLSAQIWKQTGLEGFDYRHPTVFSEPLAQRLKSFNATQ